MREYLHDRIVVQHFEKPCPKCENSALLAIYGGPDVSKERVIDVVVTMEGNTPVTGHDIDESLFDGVDDPVWICCDICDYVNLIEKP